MSSIMGKTLHVDLTKGKITEGKGIEEKLWKQYIGGRGLGEKLIWDHIGKPPYSTPDEAREFALTPENRYVIIPGPLTGTPVPTSGRFAVAFISPHSGTTSACIAGSRFGMLTKRAGYDAIIIDGKAENPCYLYITDETQEIHDASDLWGKITYETNDILLEKHGKRACVACIGPAGEMCAPIANIAHNKDSFAGRTGAGAVWGSKNLKAVVVNGKQKIGIAKPEEFKEVNRKVTALVKEKPTTGEYLHTRGTIVLMHVENMHGTLGVKNFSETGNLTYEDCNKISGETFWNNHLFDRAPCYGCPIGCHRQLYINGKFLPQAEYELTWGFGTNLGNLDPYVVTKAGEICGRYGMDGISAGNILGYAMESTVKGAHDFGITWGDKEGILRVVEEMGKGVGVGAELQMGVKRCAEKYPETADYAMHIKGNELPAYDPRTMAGVDLGYATSPRGADHMKSYMVGCNTLGTQITPKELLERTILNKDKITFTIGMQHESVFYDSAVLCLFLALTPVGVEDTASLLSTATGMDMSTSELITSEERIFNGERLWNTASGFTADDDSIPKRFTTEQTPYGGSKGTISRLKKAKKMFYEERGWGKDGVPEPWLTKYLDLDEMRKTLGV